MIRAILATSLMTLVMGNLRVQMEPQVSHFSSSKWIQEERASEDDLVKAMFVLKQNPDDMKKFEENLLDIANPKSKNYGHWLQAEDVIAMTSPSEDNVKLVTDFLSTFGVKNMVVNKFRTMIRVEMAASVAEKVLSTQFARFRSTVDNEVSIVRITRPYFLPSEIAKVIALVDDIMRFPSIRQPIVKSESKKASTDDAFNSCGAKCSGYTTPEVLRQAYGYVPEASATAGNGVAVAEFQFQYYDTTDLNSFDSACDVTVSVDTTIGGNKEKICEMGGCVEALLDIEYIGAITYPTPLTVIYSSDYSLLDWVNTVISMENPPLVHSVSYGNDEVQQTSTEYMEVCNNQFMTAGSMGLSILFAAGDQGVWGRTGAGPNQTYHPDFPAGSPYVTAVGGTNFQTESVIGAESAWDCGGGGFSDTFARPSWQDDVVSAYFDTASAAGLLPDSSLYNSAGRGYPDVAALGGETNPYCISYSGGKFGGVAGTSASCPVVAGIFSNINNERLAAGKSSLGWLNPFIYSNGQCFNDVNDGTMNNCYRGYSGFAALDGWDPATGLGTPNYSCLSSAAAFLQ